MVALMHVAEEYSDVDIWLERIPWVGNVSGYYHHKKQGPREGHYIQGTALEPLDYELKITHICSVPHVGAKE